MELDRISDDIVHIQTGNYLQYLPKTKANIYFPQTPELSPHGLQLATRSPRTRCCFVLRPSRAKYSNPYRPRCHTDHTSWKWGPPGCPKQTCDDGGSRAPRACTTGCISPRTRPRTIRSLPPRAISWDIPLHGSPRHVQTLRLTTSPGRARAPGTQQLCRNRGQRLRVLPAPAAPGRPLGLRLWGAELPAPGAGLRHVYHGVSNTQRVED